MIITYTDEITRSAIIETLEALLESAGLDEQTKNDEFNYRLKLDDGIWVTYESNKEEKQWLALFINVEQLIVMIQNRMAF